uniref:Uncharacterized protein n=1 Tax=Anguilla anguilla TaxID=7936 RepID=A0A0E9WGL4_ANGAN
MSLKYRSYSLCEGLNEAKGFFHVSFSAGVPTRYVVACRQLVQCKLALRATKQPTSMVSSVTLLRKVTQSVIIDLMDPCKLDTHVHSYVGQRHVFNQDYSSVRFSYWIRLFIH